MTIAFHISDDCNIRCSQCHWFSGVINKPKELIEYTDYINFINKFPHYKYKISGGEPTLYPQFTELVNNIPENISLSICTNGINLDVLKTIKRKVHLYVSLNRKIDNKFFNKIESLGHIVSYSTFIGIYKNISNELENIEKLKTLNIENKSCLCQPLIIRFASDGWAYNCETGIRTKDIKYRLPFSLWEGIPSCDQFKCIIKGECYSNFAKEKSYKLL